MDGRMLKRLSVLAVSLILALVIGEVGLRLFWDRPSATLAIGVTGIHQPDDDLGWRPKPNFRTVHQLSRRHAVTVTTNRQGWRDRDHEFTAPAGRRRIVVLGDSFAFGWGVEDREHFPARLEAHAPALDVVNLSAAGWHPEHYRRVLERDGLRYQPEIVIVALVQNDITAEGVPSPGSAAANIPLNKTGASESSALYLLDLWRRVKRSPAANRLRITLGWWQPDGYGQLDDHLRPALTQGPPAQAEAWRVTLERLDAIRTVVESHGARLVIATIPSKQAMEPHALTASLATSRYQPSDFEFARPYQRIDEWCRVNHLACLNGYEALRGQTDLFFRHDPHFTAKAHDLFAQALAEQISLRQR